MDSLTKSLIKDLLPESIGGKEVTALFGGGFKPPTAGHLAVIQNALKNNPEIDNIIIYVGSKVRDGITQDQAFKIWDEHYKPLIDKPVRIEKSVSPIGDIYRYAKDNPEDSIYWVIGAREGREDDLQDISSRSVSIDKYPNLNLKVTSTPDGGMSGTNARQALINNDKESFKFFIPSDANQDEIWNILTSTPLNEADPKKGTGKKPKGSGRRLYTDEDPSDTVRVKFSTRQDIVDTLNKKSFKAKSHARQSQIINLIHQRVRAALSRTKDPKKKAKLRSAFEYIKKRKEASKKKTQRLKKQKTNEAIDTNFDKIKFYYDYYTNVSPSTFGITIEENDIKISNIIESYPANFGPENVRQVPVNQNLEENIDPKAQAKHKGKAAPFGSAYKPVKEKKVFGGKSRYRAIEKRGGKYYFIQDNPFSPGIRQEFGPYKTKEAAKRKMSQFPPSQNYRDITEIIDEIIYEELCKRGYNYIAKRKREGEKHNPFLTARAVKVCKGQIKGSDGKKKKDFRPKKGKKRSAQGRKPNIIREIGIDLSNYKGQILPGDVLRAPKGFPLGGKKLEKSIQLKVIKNSREGVNRYKLSLKDKNGKRYSVRNFEMDGEYKGKKLPKWGLIRKSKKNIQESKTTHKVIAKGVVFEPKNITINVGDTVKWVNEQGAHNVNGKKSHERNKDNPESFGNKVGTGWTYEFTFTKPGLYKYHCDPHLSADMVGTVKVKDKVNEGDTYEKMAAKGKKAGSLKQGTVRKRLKIPKDKKIPLSLINKELARLRKMDKDKKKKGVQLGDKNQKYYKALQLAKTLKTTTNVNETGLEIAKKNMDDYKRSNRLNENATYSSHIDYKQEILDLTKHMLKKGMNIQPLPKVIFKHNDKGNARKFLGRTAYYNPNSMVIVLYTEGRHPKDITRSFAHEMIHHIQNLEDRLENITTTNTLEDDHLNNIEREAYTRGNMVFRNYTDGKDGEEVTSLSEKEKPYKHKYGFDKNLGKDPFGLNQFARELASLEEGRYDTLSNQISRDIFNFWKQDFNEGEKDSTYEDDYDFPPNGIQVKAQIIYKPGFKKLKVDGGSDIASKTLPGYLEVNFIIDPKMLPEFWEEISMNLKDVVRHEIEHITQSGASKTKKEDFDEDFDMTIRALVKADIIPQAEYFKLPKEVDANLQGMYFRAKKEKRPLADVINTYLDAQDITPKDKQIILDLWRSRRKALSLPKF